MRRHGWGGDPPADDAAARQRIVEAGMRCVERDGAMETTLSDIAAELQVTRQTVYRYFRSTESLFIALAERSAGEFVDRVAGHVGPIDDPVDALVETLAFGIESVPGERYIALLMRLGDAFAQGIISPVAMTFGLRLLRQLDVNWEALGYGDDDLDELVEVMLRLIQSFALTPVTPRGHPRSGAELRSFLRRWFGPTLQPHRSR